MSSSHHVLYDPEGRLTAELPPDRTVHEQVVRTALAWSSPLVVPADDVARIGRLLAGAARVVADEVRVHAERLPEDDGRRLFAELILQEADGSLSQPCTSLKGVQNRARLIRALYERLDRLRAAAPVDEAAAASS
ncbi:restriction endonuclease [Streptomyces sp. CSDS2]|uniref:restriction endonuclease n=1 Tax=Streptomyces sp. CSDS2 TaxID=3055051 RepID=UPI0025B1D265|nr:restriction endonuclease [Streptomyces sp. CSDS2]MDN3262889.1 restriction endonuclease [Streptomyces sp. CSDS2]